MWIAATVGQLSFRGSYSSLRGKGGIFHQELTFVLLNHVLESLDPNIPAQMTPNLLQGPMKLDHTRLVCEPLSKRGGQGVVSVEVGFEELRHVGCGVCVCVRTAPHDVG